MLRVMGCSLTCAGSSVYPNTQVVVLCFAFESFYRPCFFRVTTVWWSCPSGLHVRQCTCLGRRNTGATNRAQSGPPVASFGSNRDRIT